MESVTYKLSWVKTACEQVLGKTISSRAWRKWLRICGIRQYSRIVKLKECSYLLGLAYLKRQDPTKQYSLSNVLSLLSQNQERLAQFGINLEEPDFPLQGRELPSYLYEKTKRKVTIRTVYRWATKHHIPFSVSQIISPHELITWLELADKAA